VALSAPKAGEQAAQAQAASGDDSQSQAATPALATRAGHGRLPGWQRVLFTLAVLALLAVLARVVFGGPKPKRVR
jgi:hypothetical protein